MPSAHHAEHELVGRLEHWGQPFGAIDACEAGPQALIQIARKAHLGRQRRAESVFAHRVVDGRVAINPDRVIVGANGLLIGRLTPLAAHGLRTIQHVAQAEHAAGGPIGAQRGQGVIELVDGAARHLVDDQQVRPERGQRGSYGPAAQDDQLLERDIQPPWLVLAVALLVQGGKRQTIDLGR